MANPDGALLAAALDSMDFVVTSVSEDGTILFVNETAARNLSGTREELVGTSLYDYFPEQAGSSRERIRQTIRLRKPQHFEATVRLPDGREKWFDSAYYPAFDDDGSVIAVQIVARDVTALRSPPPSEARDEALWGMVTDDLSMNAERIKALLSSAPMVITVNDPDMTIRYINQVVDDLTVGDVLGTSALEWVAEQARAPVAAAFARVCATGQTTECQVTGRSGREWLLRLAPLVHDGVVKQILCCTLDITEQIRLQSHLVQVQKIESLGTMARGIAHDFNNLLAVIMGDAGLARRRAAAGREPFEQLESINTAAGRAAALCKQMLLYAGGEQPSGTPGNLNDVLTEMTRLSRAAVNANVQLRYDLADDLLPTRCDGTLLGQVVLNLINNAADAIGDAQGVVSVATDMVTLDEPDGCYLPAPPLPGTYVRLRVADNGGGIDPAVVPVIFDPFYSTKSTGRGLGLSVVLGIVSSHGGAISVASTPGNGTAITVLFPVHAGATTAPAPAEGLGEWPRGEGTVLVVDDEAAMRRMATAVLEECGFDVIQAADGDQALAALDGSLKAILLDVTMPKRDGHSALAAIRATHPDLPIILSSGKPTQLPADDARVGLLPKPYGARELAETIVNATRGRFQR